MAGLFGRCCGRRRSPGAVLAILEERPRSASAGHAPPASFLAVVCVPLPAGLLVSVAAHGAATETRAQRARLLSRPRRAEGPAVSPPPVPPSAVFRRSFSVDDGLAQDRPPSRPSAAAGARTGPSARRPPRSGCPPRAPAPPRSPPAGGPSPPPPSPRNDERKPCGTAARPCCLTSFKNAMSLSAFPRRVGSTSPAGSTEATTSRKRSASRRTSTARPHSGTRCSRFAPSVAPRRGRRAGTGRCRRRSGRTRRRGGRRRP